MLHLPAPHERRERSPFRMGTGRSDLPMPEFMQAMRLHPASSHPLLARLGTASAAEVGSQIAECQHAVSSEVLQRWQPLVSSCLWDALRVELILTQHEESVLWRSFRTSACPASPPSCASVGRFVGRVIAGRFLQQQLFAALAPAERPPPNDPSNCAWRWLGPLVESMSSELAEVRVGLRMQLDEGVAIRNELLTRPRTTRVPFGFDFSVS